MDRSKSEGQLGPHKQNHFRYNLSGNEGVTESDFQEVHKEEYTLDEIKMIMFELCYTTLKLFNKASSRIILSACYKKIKDEIPMKFDQI